MKRKVLHAFQWTLVTFLIVTMGTSPVSAGRFLKKMRCKTQSKCKPSCATVCQPTCTPGPKMAAKPVPQIAPFIGSSAPCSQSMVHSPASHSAPVCFAPMASQPMISQAIYSEPVGSAPIVMAAPTQDCCCCDQGTANMSNFGAAPIVTIGESIIVDSPTTFDSVDYSTPMDAGEITSDVPMMSTPLIEDSGASTFDSGTPVETEMTENPPAPTTVDSMATESAPADPAPMDPADSAPATDDLFGGGDEPAADAMPADPPTAVEEETPAGDDLFGGADDPAPAAATDDLFGGAAESAPADATPAPGAEAAEMDDLFGGAADPPTDAAPADTAPAADPFSAPADAAPAADPFGAPTDDAAPAADPPASDGGLDDLFGGGSDMTPEAAAPAAEVASNTDDVFGDVAAEGESSTDDIFSAPAAEGEAAPADDLFSDPAPATDDAEESKPDATTLDDLFGGNEPTESTDSTLADLFGPEETEPVATEPFSTEPVTSEPAVTEPASEMSIDDLFGATETAKELPAPVVATSPVPVVASESGLQVVSITPQQSIDPLSDTHERTWIDNTGNFSTVGRLIQINSDNVRLMKANGRTCTVPLSRMCLADASYVDSIRTELTSSRIALLTSK